MGLRDKQLQQFVGPDKLGARAAQIDMQVLWDLTCAVLHLQNLFISYLES